MSHPEPTELDLAHRIFYVPNLSIARIRGHKSRGRLPIRFNEESFLTWRKAWGNNVFFTRLEYRKQRGGVKHELILLRGLSSNAPRNCNSPSQVEETLASSQSPSNPRWWTTIPEDIGHFVLKFERMAHPQTQLNALIGTESLDYVDFRQFAHLDEDDWNSTTELAITFPEKVPLEEVIKICASISRHQSARLYTLRQFNCFFYSWAIITILLRLHVDWAPALHSNADRTLQLLTTRLIELSNPQRTRPQPRYHRFKPNPELRPSLALLVAGEYDCTETEGVPQRPFITLCHKMARETPVLPKILEALQSPKHKSSLWVDTDLSKVRDHIRILLDKIADSTTSLATEGTGEMTIDALFWGDGSIPDLPDEWKGPISEEVNALLEIYVNEMWSSFNEALKQTHAANLEKQLEQSPTHHRQSNEVQRIGRSRLVLLGTRLTPMGIRAAWNAARVRAHASTGLTNSPLLPLLLLMETMRDVPNQIRHVSSIAHGFLAVYALRREEARAEIYETRANRQQNPDNPASTSRNVSLGFGRETVLGMMSGIDIRRPELEDQVVRELEKAIKRLALKRPNCDMRELRMVTLEMLICLKKTGQKINFGLRHESMWRICLWCSLGEEIVRVLEEAAELGPTGRVHGWIRTFENETRGEERPMLISDIQTFIRGRIRALSEMIHNQGGPGATAHCREEIETALDTIWKGILQEDKTRQSQSDPESRH
ncbi:hypothetical protein B0J17DRAFT_768138 [Rhizoctonia solani]|nr:hypothetical protein B0J17DRAFT_768138 [Rhizoctonia solani]